MDEFTAASWVTTFHVWKKLFIVNHLTKNLIQFSVALYCCRKIHFIAGSKGAPVINSTRALPYIHAAMQSERVCVLATDVVVSIRTLLSVALQRDLDSGDQCKNKKSHFNSEKSQYARHRFHVLLVMKNEMNKSPCISNGIDDESTHSYTRR